MLKHVQISPLRNRTDSLSLRSSTVSSCASSMCGSPEPPNNLQRTPSRASSYSSLNEQLPQTTIKVYTNCLKIDIEYKTLGIQWDTTSKDVIAQLLRRLKMRHRDPRLFYLSMEVAVRRAGVKTILVLDDDTRPAILQACHPKGESRFCLQLKPGGLIRVHTSALQPSSQYKSLVISEETTSDELLQLLLGCYNSIESVEQFSIYEVCPGQEYQRKLHPDDIPLRAQAERMKRGETCHFLVRRNPNYARRRQLLASLNDAMQQRTTASKSFDNATLHDDHDNDDDDDDAVGNIDENNSLMDLSIESLSDELHSLMTTSDEDEDEDCASSASSSGSSDTSTECSTTTTTLSMRRNMPGKLMSMAKHNSSNMNKNKSAKHTNTTVGIAAVNAATAICFKCRNNFKSCEFCQQNSALITSNNNNKSTIAQQQQQHVAASPPRTYSPVYNVREIRTATHSFSALGKDKKLLDIHLNARFEMAACRLRTQSICMGMMVTGSSNSNSNSSSTCGSDNTSRMIMDAAVAKGDVNGNKAEINLKAAGIETNMTSAKPMQATTTTTIAGEAVNNNPAKGLGHFVYL